MITRDDIKELQAGSERDDLCAKGTFNEIDHDEGRGSRAHLFPRAVDFGGENGFFLRNHGGCFFLLSGLAIFA